MTMTAGLLLWKIKGVSRSAYFCTKHSLLYFECVGVFSRCNASGKRSTLHSQNSRDIDVSGLANGSVR